MKTEGTNDAKENPMSNHKTIDTNGWRELSPGEVIPAGTPYLATTVRSPEVWSIRCRAVDSEVSGSRNEVLYADLPLVTEGPDLSLIPSSREGARVLEVNGVVATYYRDGINNVRAVDASPGLTHDELITGDITSVREVHVLADDQVAVDAARQRRIERAIDIAVALAATPEGQRLSLAADTSSPWSIVHILSILPDHVLADDRVAVPRELVERAKALLDWCREPGSERKMPEAPVGIVRDLAAVDRGAES